MNPPQTYSPCRASSQAHVERYRNSPVGKPELRPSSSDVKIPSQLELFAMEHDEIPSKIDVFLGGPSGVDRFWYIHV